MGLWDAFPSNRLLVDVSVWSAELANLESSIHLMEPYADLFHFDVADGHFVPSLLFFPDLVEALRPLTRVPFHIHLMADRPVEWIDVFADAGADLITIHLENGESVFPALHRIRSRNCRAGLALTLDTPVSEVVPYLGQLDAVILMGTALGIKGVTVAPEACPRIVEMKRLLLENERASAVKIFADGGIRDHTVPTLRAAGADAVVPGSLVFQSPDIVRTFQWLHSQPS